MAFSGGMNHKLLHFPLMVYYSAIKKDDLLHTPAWMNLKGNMLGERVWLQKGDRLYVSIYVTFFNR